MPTEVAPWNVPSSSCLYPDQIRTWLADGRIVDALNILRSLDAEVQLDGGRQIRFLLLSAHSLLDQCNAYAADRCIQTAMRVLAAEDPSHNSLTFTEWLVLATSAILRRDWQSYSAWLRQVECCLHRAFRPGSSGQFLEAAGDVFALRACASAGQGFREDAKAHFQKAAECHNRAIANRSAARDLILLSRVLQMDAKFQEAESRLLEAERHLRSTVAFDSHSERLLRAIGNDRQTLECQTAVIASAKWN